VAAVIDQKPELFDELMSIYLKGTEPSNRRAAWAADMVSEKRPELVAPHLGKLTLALPAFDHSALKRHALRILTRSPLPGHELLGGLINICFEWLTSASIPVAPKIFCMEMLYRISETEPDLKKELADSIEWRMNEETPGFRNRGGKMLKKLFKEINSQTNNPV
jgi:hypothetical protein